MIRPAPSESANTCRLCGSGTILLGAKRGWLTQRLFHLHRCPACQFAFVADPWTEYATIYSEDYYRGRGADPYVDYIYELNNPESSIRAYEWGGVLASVQSLVGIEPHTRWLDFGCGNAGLLRYCKKHVEAQLFGFEEGWIASAVSQLGIPLLSQADLSSNAASFDIITAIEVFEHICDPVETVATLRKLLKPGGLLFFTTGNPQPYRDDFLKWEYVYPEIHVSFFEPATMNRLLTDAGFQTEFRGYLAGHSNIIRYKVLKRLGLKRQAFWEQVLPWPIISRAIDRRLKISSYPVAWA
jgi:SAM-dependent methyltransferase